MQAENQPSDIHLAVYARGDDALFIDLARGNPALTDSAAALAQGYLCCGFFTLVDGIPRVECQPGPAAAYGMLRAGVTLAEMLGAPAGQVN